MRIAMPLLWSLVLVHGCADVSRLDDFEFVDPTCEPEDKDTTCFQVACGSVENNCGVVVNCERSCPGVTVCAAGDAPANTCGCTRGDAAPIPPAECMGPFANPNGHGYYVCAKDNFEDGRDRCRSFGVDLVIIADEQENAFVHDLIPPDGTNAHLGLWEPDCQAPEGVPCNFTWIDGAPLSYSNWKPTEPNNAGGTENCVEMDDNGGGWNDVDCGTRRHVICETTCP